MRIYRVLICAIILFAVANNVLTAQKLRLVRTDVDSTRFGFVTATYLFGIDIYVEEIDSCTSVSFDLNYTNSNYISFSEARSTPFGYGGKGPVIISRKNLDNTGYVYVGVLSGDEVGARGYDNPKVIHLEFVVAQDAIHGFSTVFSFSNVQAVISSGNSGRIIPVAADPITFDIHSFINVWPGDADNDGEVTTKDVTSIGRFIGYGSSSKTSMRSFKRMNASTIWAPQSVLAWDSIDVAHADCDGNGDVTVTDQLIVALNFGKVHSFSGKINYKSNTSIMTENNQNTINISANTNRKNIYINSIYSYIGVAGKISWIITDPYTKVIGIEKGDLFKNESSELFYRIVGNEADISLINSNSVNRTEAIDGNLCTLLIDGNPESVSLNMQDIYAISHKNGFFKINATSDVEQNHPDKDETLLVNYIDSYINLTNTSNESIIYSVYDLLGVQLYSGEIEAEREIKMEQFNISKTLFVVYYDKFNRRRVIKL